MKNNLCISLLLTILLSSFYACDKDNNSIEIKTLEVEQGNDASTLISVLGAAKGGELTNEDIDHYCILSFQRLFSDDNRYYFKTLSARTINTPMIQSLRIDEHTIPPLDDGFFNFTFSNERDKFIDQNNEFTPTLVPQTLKDVELQITQQEGIVQHGNFPRVGDISISFNNPLGTSISKHGGQELVWNSEFDTGLPVVIMIDSTTGIGPNAVKYIVTEDDGSYTFTEEDLSGMPTNSTLNLTFIKGNYVLSTNNILIGSAIILFADNQYFVIP